MPKYHSKDPEERKAERQAWVADKHRREANVRGREIKQTVMQRIEKEDSKPKKKPDYSKMGILDKGELPDDIVETIADFVEVFCDAHGIEDMRKASAQVWSAACMQIGWTLTTPRGWILDREKSIAKNQPIYDPEKVSLMIDLWAYFSALYGKPPIKSDFYHFADVSGRYTTGGLPRLTSHEFDVSLEKKISDAQESGLATRLVDGKNTGNPIGTMFFLKNFHGWRDQREIVHSDGASYTQVSELPVFDAPPELTDDIIDGDSE